jgi:uncharacterized FlaG/YvyC family protein
MDPISPISVIPEASPQTFAPPARRAERALDFAVSRAVNSLNEAGYAGAGREISISSDPSTRRPVIEVVDSQTKTVLFQWPSAYVLELAMEQARRSGAVTGS